MAIIEDVKCPRCDRKYSGIRSRCPFCGARRIGFGKYSKEADNNARGKMLISILILAVFTVAAGVMLFSSQGTAEQIEATATPDPEAGVNVLPGIEYNTPTPYASPTPTPVPEATIVEVLYDNRSLASPNSFTRNVNPSHSNGGPLSGFTVRVEPLGFDLPVEIISDDEEIFTVERTNESAPYNFTVHPVSPGSAKLIATCGEKSHTVHVTITG